MQNGKGDRRRPAAVDAAAIDAAWERIFGRKETVPAGLVVPKSQPLTDEQVQALVREDTHA